MYVHHFILIHTLHLYTVNCSYHRLKCHQYTRKRNESKQILSISTLVRVDAHIFRLKFFVLCNSPLLLLLMELMLLFNICCSSTCYICIIIHAVCLLLLLVKYAVYILYSFSFVLFSFSTHKFSIFETSFATYIRYIICVYI